MTRRSLSLGRLKLAVGTLSSNSHGPEFTTLKLTMLLCRFGNPPLSWRSWRLYFYGPTGACIHFDFRILP